MLNNSLVSLDFVLLSSIVIFVVVYGLIIFRNARGVNIPIWVSMTIGAISVLILQTINIHDAFSAINFDVIFFLLGMFVLVSGLESSGMLSYVTQRILKFAKNPNQILFFILFVMGLMSAFLINDTIALVATPIVIGLAKSMNIRPAVLLISLAFGITIGSMMTPMGNPQNLLISLHSGMNSPLFTFLYYLILPTITCLASTYFILKWYYRKELSNVIITNITFANNVLLDNNLAKKSSMLIIITVIGFFIVGVIKLFDFSIDLNFSHVAIIGGAGLLLISNKKKQIIKGVNWQILVFFIAMFVLMQGLWNGGMISLFQNILPVNPNNTSEILAVNIIGTSVLTSQIVSNVPFVAIYLPILQNSGFSEADVLAWILLAASSTIAGNLTILAAASNVIIIEIAEKRKSASFTFKEFLKIGSLVTLSNVLILLFFAVVLW